MYTARLVYTNLYIKKHKVEVLDLYNLFSFIQRLIRLKIIIIYRFYGMLNYLGLYNKNAKILFLVRFDFNYTRNTKWFT